MRPTLLIAAALMAAIASAAVAQPRPYSEISGTAAVPPPPAPPQDEAFTASTVAADLSGLNVRIEQDEARMTSLRDAELAHENARIRALKPALSFRGRDWFPLKY